MAARTDSFQEELGYDATVGELVYRERTASYPLPLRDQDRKALFSEWVSKNGEAVRWMESKAVALELRGEKVSSKYLFEAVRYETEIELVPVPFLDGQGVEHEYGANNSDTALFARWLLERHPGMNIETRRSPYDRRKR